MNNNNDIEIHATYYQRMMRQLPILTACGQKTISNTKIAIIGLGGNGSNLLSQLVQLGFLRFILIDDDKHKCHNANRNPYAGINDIGEYKVHVAKRSMETRFPGVQIQTIPSDVRSPGVLEQVSDCNWIFEAVDNDSSRHWINEQCYKTGKPMISVASGFFIQDGKLLRAGSRVNRVIPGIDACLECQVLDESEANHAHASLSTPNMFATGLAADMLVRELTNYATPGLEYIRANTTESDESAIPDDGINFISFDLLTRQLFKARILPRPNCPICGNQNEENPVNRE